MLLRMWRKGNPLALLVEMQTDAASLENSVEVPQKKLKIELPYDSAIALLGIYPKDSGVLIQRGTCTPMSIAVLSTIAKLWKEPKCPLTDEWIKKMWYRGAWVVQSVERPTLAQVMISQFVSSSPTSGSVLTAQSLKPASDSVSPSLSDPPLFMLSLCLRNKLFSERYHMTSLICGI